MLVTISMLLPALSLSSRDANDHAIRLPSSMESSARRSSLNDDTRDDSARVVGEVCDLQERVPDILMVLWWELRW
jgi:hypothetical protein